MLISHAAAPLKNKMITWRLYRRTGHWPVQNWWDFAQHKPICSPAHDAANASGDFLTIQGPHRAVDDLGQSTAGLLFPSSLNLGSRGVQLFGQALKQFANFFGRPVARLLNNLFQCQWHGAQHSLFWVATQWRSKRMLILSRPLLSMHHLYSASDETIGRL
jgi:hypothetical protein